MNVYQATESLHTSGPKYFNNTFHDTSLRRMSSYKPYRQQYIQEYEDDRVTSYTHDFDDTYGREGMSPYLRSHGGHKMLVKCCCQGNSGGGNNDLLAGGAAGALAAAIILKLMMMMMMGKKRSLDCYAGTGMIGAYVNDNKNMMSEPTLSIIEGLIIRYQGGEPPDCMRRYFCELNNKASTSIGNRVAMSLSLVSVTWMLADTVYRYQQYLESVMSGLEGRSCQQLYPECYGKTNKHTVFQLGMV